MSASDLPENGKYLGTAGLTELISLIKDALPEIATSTSVGLVKPDNDTISIDNNGEIFATATPFRVVSNVTTEMEVRNAWYDGRLCYWISPLSEIYIASSYDLTSNRLYFVPQFFRATSTSGNKDTYVETDLCYCLARNLNSATEMIVNDTIRMPVLGIPANTSGDYMMKATVSNSNQKATYSWTDDFVTSSDLNDKYDKTGGNISGNVDIDGTLKFNIEDQSYTVDTTITPSFDGQVTGGILDISTHASGTTYKTLLRNIATPINNFDAVNKQYVDNLINITWITGAKDDSGLLIDSNAYDKSYDAVTNNKMCFIKCVCGTGSGSSIVTTDTTIFRLKNWNNPNGHSSHTDSFEFLDLSSLDKTKTITVTYSGATYSETTLERTSNKVTTFTGSSTDTQYPSAKLCEDMFSYIGGNYQKKPVVIWEETTPANYLKGIQADISASPAWQLTNLDMTPYKRIKIYACAGQKSGATASASTTPAVVLEMSLDSRNAISAYGSNYIASVWVQKPNDANRLASLTCAVSADKTKFVVLRQTSLYGTAATANNDVNANVFLIEGYYD